MIVQTGPDGRVSDTVSDTLAPAHDHAVVAVVQYVGGEKGVIELARGTLAQCEAYAEHAGEVVEYERKDGTVLEIPAVTVPLPAGREAAGAVLAVVPVADLQSA